MRRKWGKGGEGKVVSDRRETIGVGRGGAEIAKGE